MRQTQKNSVYMSYCIYFCADVCYNIYMVIKGSVSAVIFNNPENGYTVMEFQTADRHLTAVGCLPYVREGETLTLDGEWSLNPKYGEQFKFENATFESPTDLAGIEAFLSSGLFPGIGASIAANIVKMFGTDSLDVIENHPEKLRKVVGIGRRKAQAMATAYKETTAMRSTIIFLQKHSVSVAQAVKIYNVYGEKSESVVTQNPYALVRDVEGIGFVTADAIAQKIGFDRNSDFRINAGILYALNEAGNRGGHTALPEQTLIHEASVALRLDNTERIEFLLPKMVLSGELRTMTLNDDGQEIRVYATALNYNAENSIASRLIRVAADAKDLSQSVEHELEAYERTNNIYLDKKQREAVSVAVNKGVSVITGGPGTGKTTIIKCVTELCMARGLDCSLCAPTGRAAKRLSEATGEDAKTIHRLLGLDMSSGRPLFKYNESNVLSADMVIVDEISMADIYIFNALLRALKHGAKLLLVGDKDQLPSVSPGNVLADIIATDLLPITYLDTIYRQDENSLIIPNAHRINNGEMPIIKNSSNDFFLINQTDPESIAKTVVGLVSKRLPDFFHISPTEIQVLSPVKRGVAGVENLNVLLQHALNPTGTEVTIKGVTYRVGDKVMHTVNNYDIEWKRGTETGTGVFNGEIGYVIAIIRGELVVEFDDGKTVEYDRATQEDLMLAYAVSVHKSQGSEFPIAVISLPASGGMLMCRNLLYTAVTRAKNAVVLVGGDATVSRMVKNDYTAKRYTLLRELLCKTSKKATLLGI